MRNRNDCKIERMKHIWQPLSQMLAVAAASISDKLRAFLKLDPLSRVSSTPHELEVHAQNSGNSIVKVRHFLLPNLLKFMRHTMLG